MGTYPNISITTNSLRPEERVGAGEGTQELQNAFKSLSNAWGQAKDLVQTLLQQRASVLGPVQSGGLQAVRNINKYILSISPEQLSTARLWWRPISRSVSLLHLNYYLSSHPVLTTYTDRLHPGIIIPDARSLTMFSHL